MPNTREKLIEILRKPIFPHELVDPIEAVADYLLDSGVTVQEWISVKDRWPEEWTDVLARSKCGFCVVAVSLGSHGKWRESWTHMMIDDDTITHWMPLPQPPKGE